MHPYLEDLAELHVEIVCFHISSCVACSDHTYTSARASFCRYIPANVIDVLDKRTGYAVYTLHKFIENGLGKKLLVSGYVQLGLKSPVGLYIYTFYQLIFFFFLLWPLL